MKFQDTYIYPASFFYEENQIRIQFPDLPDCFGAAPTDQEAFYKAKALLRDQLLLAERKNVQLPSPSSLADLTLPEGSRICLIQVCLAPYREAFHNRAVKKTLTIPAWLNDLAEKEGVNFSFVLQQALKEQLNLNR